VLLLSVVIVVWSLAPIYNMVLISLEPEGDVFTDHIWPRVPSLESFWGVLTQGHWYLEHFWHQFANSFFIGAMVTFFALLFGSMTSFSIGRMRIRHGWLVSNAALLTYVIPASFLGDPFLPDHAELRAREQPVVGDRGPGAFATPYAIFVFQEYGRQHPDRGRRVRAHRRRLADPDLSADLPAADGAGPRRGRHLRAAASPGTIPVSSSCSCPRSRA
jgi:multiple sugar transport system permease protein